MSKKLTSKTIAVGALVLLAVFLVPQVVHAADCDLGTALYKAPCAVVQFTGDVLGALLKGTGDLVKGVGAGLGQLFQVQKA